MPERYPRTGIVSQAYQQPYPDSIRVRAGERVAADFTKATDVPGWVWCRDARERSGWTSVQWLQRDGALWRIAHDFDAIELSDAAGVRVSVHAQIAGFCCLTTQDGRTGRIPASHIRFDEP